LIISKKILCTDEKSDVTFSHLFFFRNLLICLCCLQIWIFFLYNSFLICLNFCHAWLESDDCIFDFLAFGHWDYNKIFKWWIFKFSKFEIILVPALFCSVIIDSNCKVEFCWIYIFYIELIVVLVLSCSFIMDGNCKVASAQFFKFHLHS